MPVTDTSSFDAAIAAALHQNWKEAIRINASLLKKDKTDIESLNRLAFAYLKMGELSAAKRTYQKVLKLDSYNQIALKNLKRLSTLKRKDIVKKSGAHISPLSFLEEPGKTKIASCINLAPISMLSSISSGQEVYLKARNHVVEIRDEKNSYLGALPDDLSFRLIHLLAAGNRYQVVVKGAGKNFLTVILREIFRAKRFSQYPSFSPSPSYIPLGREPASENSSEESAEEEEKVED